MQHEKDKKQISRLVNGEYGQNIYEGANKLVCQFLITHITKLHITKLYLSISKPSLCFFGLRPKKQGMVKIKLEIKDKIGD